MSKFIRSFAFKIWVPFSVTLLVIISITAWYYPKKQEQFFIENKTGQVLELAKTVAKSYELAFTDADETQVFKRVTEIINFAKNDHDIDYIEIYENGKLEHQYDKNSQALPKLIDNDKYIYQDSKFSYSDDRDLLVHGFVRIAILKEGIASEIDQLNRPIYFILFGIALFFILAFLFLARWLSKPITNITSSTLAMSKQDFSIDLPQRKSSDELGMLITAINELKDNLIDQKEKNDRFVLELESIVEQRTLVIAENEKNYRSLIDSSTEMIQRLNPQGEIVYVNRAWLENMGYSSLEEVKGRSIIDFFTENTIREFSEVMPILVKGVNVDELVCEFVSKQGQILNIKGRAKPILENEVFSGSQAFLFNVTSVLKAEREIERMSKIQNLLMQVSTEYINAPVSDINRLINQSLSDIASFSSADRAYVFEYNYEKEICSITHEWYDTGIPPQIDELRVMPFSEMTYSLSKHSKGDFVEFPDVYELKDKKIRAILSGEGIQSLISIPMMDGDLAIGFIGFDIMKTKRAFTSDEKNLLRSYSQMIVNVFNRKKFIEELQNTKDALSNINVSLEKKVRENTKKNIDLSRSILEQEKLVTIGEISAGIAHDLNTPLGTIRVGSDNVSFILDKLFRDNLSDFKREELIEILDYVKRNKIEIYVGGLQIRKEKEDMVNFLTEKYVDLSIEELNTYGDLLVKCRINLSQEELIDKMLKRTNGLVYLEVLSQVQMAMAQLNTIKSSSDKAVRVVQDMRAFIKGETTVERKLINLRENISTVLRVFNYEINLNVDLKFEVDEQIEFSGFDIKLFQLWSNLVKNALEAMSDQKEKYLGIFASKTGSNVVVTFENNGPKIPDDIVKNIFTKFYTTKSKQSGSGLGLSIVKNVLKEHKANIIIESSDAVTKFIITFHL